MVSALVMVASPAPDHEGQFIIGFAMNQSFNTVLGSCFIVGLMFLS